MTPVDDLFQTCPAMTGIGGGRHYLALGGIITRYGNAWVLDKDGARRPITVPATIAALDAREAADRMAVTG